MITVLKPGLMTSIQDLGRYGYQKYGVITSGAMDPIAHRIANVLVGNSEDTATIEITLIGPVLRFEKDAVISLCGGNLSPKINGSKVRMRGPICVNKGDILEFGVPKKGCRTYLAVYGGFDIPKVMGSASTYLRANIGGFNGRLLKAGDQIEFIKSECSNISAKIQSGPSWKIPQELFQWTIKEKEIRVIKGRQFDWITEESRRLFFEEPFTVSLNSDRMGYRLKGPILQKQAEKEMISEAVSFGSIQVPTDGDPIILLADRQTVGGYPKIMQIATVDFSAIAQTKPGESIHFKEITHDEAQRLFLFQEEVIQNLKRSISLKYK